MMHCFTRPGHREQFSCDFHILEFSDEGALGAQPRLEEVEERIKALRREFSSGVVVVVFIHGWHHSADPEDEHLNAFRRIIEVITVREWEIEDRPVRPVVGVYVGWNGDPIGTWSAIKRVWGIKHLSFWRRYRVAKSIGASPGFQKTLAKIISAAKAPLDDAQGNRTVESPLVLAGHSMGSLILQSAFGTLLGANCDELLFRDVDSERVRLPDVVTFRNGSRVFFPDLLLCLNSAADSDIARGMIKVLKESKIRRCAETPPVQRAAHQVQRAGLRLDYVDGRYRHAACMAMGAAARGQRLLATHRRPRPDALHTYDDASESADALSEARGRPRLRSGVALPPRTPTGGGSSRVPD